MAAAVEINELVVEFASGSAARGPVRALDRVSLSVGAGRVFGFLGPNGAGKTTAIQVMLGFVPATAGSVRLLGEDVARSPARRRVGYLPETPGFYPFLSGRELLLSFGRLFGLRGAPRRERAQQLLERVGLREAADRRIGVYSRGMLQRIGLAQALINEPELVVLDEPTSGMDPLGRMDIRALIAELRGRGTTVFFSSHELSEVELVCDEIAILARGRVVAHGAPGALKQPGESLERFFLRAVGGGAPGEARA